MYLYSCGDVLAVECLSIPQQAHRHMNIDT